MRASSLKYQNRIKPLMKDAMPCFAHLTLVSCLLASLSFASAKDSISLPAKLHDLNGSEVATESLSYKFVGLYFSASWCGPCRKFSPQLVDFRNENLDVFEVILISADGNAKAQQNYMRKFKMAWPALENQPEEARRISTEAKVAFLPSLIILDENGKIISRSGKDDIIKYRENTIDYWKSL